MPGVGEPGGVGLGFAFGVPFAGEGSTPPALVAAVLVGVAPAGGVVEVGIGLGVGVGPGTGGFVGVFVGTCVGGDVGTGVAVGFDTGVSVGTGGVETGLVGLSAGDKFIPDVVVSNGITIAVACVAVCSATIPVTENNNNAELMARVRRTQYAIIVDFLFVFIKPRIINPSIKRTSKLAHNPPKLALPAKE